MAEMITGVPSLDGWGILPREAIPAMERAGVQTFGGQGDNAGARYECAVMYRVMRDAASAPETLSKTIAAVLEETDWRGISTVSYNREVRVRVGGMTFHAMLVPDAGMNEDESTCDQWRATREGEHPPCWSEGGCYTTNADSMASMQPTMWSSTTG